MIEYIQKRKTELRTRAESYRESVMQEYTGTAGDSASFSGIGLIGSGLILTVFLVLRYINPEIEKPAPADQDAGRSGTPKNENNENPHLRDEFRDKLVMVGLEVLRQVLLTVVGKLTPSDEKTGVR